MEDEELEIVADEQEAETTDDNSEEAPKEITGDDEAEQNSDDAEDEEGEVENTAPELVSVELDGVEYEVPAELAPSIMKNKDYTTKTQGLADDRKAFDVDREQFAAEKVRTEEDIKLDAQSYHLTEELKQYEDVNWETEQQNDSELASQHFMRMQGLKDKLQGVDNQRKESADKRSQEATQAVTKRSEEADVWATKNLPGWSPKMAEDLFNFATQDLGYSQEEFAKDISPKFLDLLSKAHVGQLAIKKTKQAKTVKKQVSPTKTVSAKSPATSQKDPDKMSMAEFATWFSDT